MAEALEVTVTAAVASFRDPLYSAIQKSLPCPPPATIGGMLAAAAGGWDHVDPDTRFAAAFTAAGDGVDVETWHPIGSNGKRFDAQPRDRDFLVDVKLSIWFTMDVEIWLHRLRRPVYGLTLGRSQDLAGVSTRIVHLIESTDVPIGQTIFPTDEVGNLRLPTAVSHDRGRTRWGSYWYFPDGGDRPIGPAKTTEDGRAVVLLPYTHPQRIEEP